MYLYRRLCCVDMCLCEPTSDSDHHHNLHNRECRTANGWARVSFRQTYTRNTHTHIHFRRIRTSHLSLSLLDFPIKIAQYVNIEQTEKRKSGTRLHSYFGTLSDANYHSPPTTIHFQPNLFNWILHTLVYGLRFS